MLDATALVTFYVFRFIVSRLSSEAMEITTGEDSLPPAYVDRFIVKKLGKEFIVRSSDIEWIEAAGNYMNIHIGGRCYPIRSTMDALITRLEPKNFTRIHRSSIVNLNMIVEISPLNSGDFEILLNNEKTLRLSRRYRDDIKKQLQI
ncbi:MAG: DNA-binding LytR/AlgR family response regulator [Paraglaciecola sp.]